MKLSKSISQRQGFVLPALGSTRFLSRNFGRRMVALVAIFFTLMLGARGALAADSTPMSNATQGYLVEELSGKVLEEQNSDTAYNPASAVKILTAYATLKQMGPDFRFETKVSLDGTTDGPLFEGNIFIEGIDPFLNVESLRDIVAALKERGISQVKGTLFVNPEFIFAGNTSGQRSANVLVGLLSKRKGKVKIKQHAIDGVTFKLSRALVKAPPANAEVLKVVASQTVLAILKDMLSRSDNEIAATFGRLLGGPQAIARTCRADFNLNINTLSIATASGLGVNRVTPKAMIAALNGFKRLLQSFKLKLSDALPIAGVDIGTICRRFAESPLKGTMVGKTGTLKETDSGASVLVGEMSTQVHGQILFVIFQRGRNTAKLRLSQNNLLEDLLIASGGPGIKYDGYAQ
ncbi:hypothetical protein BH10CYA1_BH10CYA1_32520 [soil metagenome]